MLLNRRLLQGLTNCFQYILNHEGDLDLCMSLSVTPNQTNEEMENVENAQGLKTESENSVPVSAV